MSDSEKIEELTGVVRQLTRELAEFTHRVELLGGRVELLSDQVVHLSVKTNRVEISLDLDAKRDAEKKTKTNERHWEMMERLEARLRKITAANARIEAQTTAFKSD